MVNKEYIIRVFFYFELNFLNYRLGKKKSYSNNEIICSVLFQNWNLLENNQKRASYFENLTIALNVEQIVMLVCKPFFQVTFGFKTYYRNELIYQEIRMLI